MGAFIPLRINGWANQENGPAELRRSNYSCWSHLLMVGTAAPGCWVGDLWGLHRAEQLLGTPSPTSPAEGCPKALQTLPQRLRCLAWGKCQIFLLRCVFSPLGQRQAECGLPISQPGDINPVPRLWWQINQSLAGLVLSIQIYKKNDVTDDAGIQRYRIQRNSGYFPLQPKSQPLIELN